jgi:hypothetical protein
MFFSTKDILCTIQNTKFDVLVAWRASGLRTQSTLLSRWALRSTLMPVDQRAVGLG